MTIKNCGKRGRHSPLATCFNLSDNKISILPTLYVHISSFNCVLLRACHFEAATTSAAKYLHEHQTSRIEPSLCSLTLSPPSVLYRPLYLSIPFALFLPLVLALRNKDGTTSRFQETLSSLLLTRRLLSSEDAGRCRAYERRSMDTMEGSTPSDQGLVSMAD